jgi:predicted enzyme related to lactoylglutathione lyase
MANAHGTPVWYELMTRDADAAQRFYAQVVGWTIASAGMEGMDYRICTAPDGEAVAGVMTPPEGGPPPQWLFYIGVDDVDAAVDACTAAGATLQMPAFEVPEVGRMALLADPHGTPFYVMRGASEEASRAFVSRGEAPGHGVWNELTAPDQDAAMRFYGTVFGWREEGAMPMGALGDYRFILNGEEALGATMSTAAGPQGWQFYFQVEDVDAAVVRLKEAGGTLMQGPDEIPGGRFSVVAKDREGARFGFVGARTGGAA